MSKIKLGTKLISNNSLPYIIAEIGVNHECSLKKAKKLILNAKRGGADLAKFQTYKAHLITSKYAKSYWDTKKKEQKINLNYLRSTIILKKNITKSYINIVKK